MEYDPESNGLKTISLHQFEDDELRVGICIHASMSVLLSDTHAHTYI